MVEKTLSVKQIQELDRVAIEEYGVPSIALMENAGRSVADEALRLLKRVKYPTVCVVCGLGNNAGDGFVAARHLINAGVKIKIFLIGLVGTLKGDAAINYQIFHRLKYPVKELKAVNAPFLKVLGNSDLVIDAIFGVGLNRDVRDPFRSIIEAVNKTAKKIVAVDIPSGLDGTTGNIYGVAIKATSTVTFSFAKKGLVKNQGPRCAGKVKIVDIGIPKW